MDIDRLIALDPSETASGFPSGPHTVNDLLTENGALKARVAELEAALRQAERSRDEWKSDHAVLSQAVVGDTGLSAMLVATQARLYRPRAERAEAALATAMEYYEAMEAFDDEKTTGNGARCLRARAAIRALKGGAA